MLAPAIIRAGPGLSCAGSPRQDRSARLAACGGHLYFLLAQAGRCTYCAAIVSRGEYLHAAPAVVVGCMLHRSPPSYDFVRLTSRESAGSSPRSELPSKGTGESFTPHLSGRRFRARRSAAAYRPGSIAEGATEPRPRLAVTRLRPSRVTIPSRMHRKLVLCRKNGSCAEVRLAFGTKGLAGGYSAAGGGACGRR